jgi:protein phosphatase 1G
MDEICETPEGKNKLKQYCKVKGRDAGPQSLAWVAGATACVALITPDTIYVANAGDSRSVLCKRSPKGFPESFDLSIDHKPSLPTEQLRIEQAGMFVEEDRVNGILNLSRSLGDLEYKKNGAKSKEL